MTIRRSATLVALFALVLSAMVPIAAFGDEHGTPYDGNPDCEELGYDAGFKINGSPSGYYDDFDGFAVNVQSGTDSEGGWLSFSGASPAVDAVLVKGGSGGTVYSYNPPATSDDGPLRTSLVGKAQDSFAAVSHVEFCIDDDDPVASVRVVKEWTGDDEGQATASVLVNDATSYDLPVTRDVTALQGRSFDLEEEAPEGLPTGCTSTFEGMVLSGDEAGQLVDNEDGTYTYTAPDGIEGDVTDIITITNDVDCGVDDDPAASVRVVKEWTGDDEGQATASVLVNDATSYDLPVTRDVTALQGRSFDLEEEAPEGLPTGCTSTFEGMVLSGDEAGQLVDNEDGTYTYTAPDGIEGDVTDIITITNDVDCDDDTPPRITPDPDPETYDITFLKDWAGDVDGLNPGPTVNTGNVTVEFTVELNGEELDDTFAPGDVLEVDEGDDVAITGETHSDLNPNFCEAAIALPGALTDVTSDGTLTVINTVDCAEVLAEVVEQPEEEPEEKPVKTEVLAEVEELPETGASALLLSLMGLLSIGVGGGMISTRKRS